jgi:serine-type D-Ala-D-Ala carboxypeptidase/endopeptidase
MKSRCGEENRPLTRTLMWTLKLKNKAVVILALALATACVSSAQDISGDWQGSLNTGMGELRIVLHVTKSPEGTLKATLDSPDQGIAGMTVDTITLDGAKLKFAVNFVKGTYEGALKNASSIAGNWSQPNKLPLDFKKTTTPVNLNHPPAPPSDIDGAWEGTLETPSQGKLRLVFHLKNTGDGLTATMDSPDQKIARWPATSVTRKGSSVKIEMAQVSGIFHGKLNKDLNSMSGDWSQGDLHYSLSLKHAKEEPADTQKP